MKGKANDKRVGRVEETERAVKMRWGMWHLKDGYDIDAIFIGGLNH